MNKERLGSMPPSLSFGNVCAPMTIEFFPSLSFGNVCVPMTIEFFRVSLLEMYVPQ